MFEDSQGEGGAVTVLGPQIRKLFTSVHRHGLVTGRVLQNTCSGLAGNLAIFNVHLPNASGTLAVSSTVLRAIRSAYDAAHESHRILVGGFSFAFEEEGGEGRRQWMVIR
eukprot:7507452-Pyramimonas_sp.AAC.1